ncbi:UNVERIFIED_CONTAM: WUSCHEL-related homeobox 11 [Sesamum radiatum]|uniref:Protein WUSCHEL n=1 Tax=Sesamum radiatum TaxID=300843 RepID=A0AAW2TJJ0_SESRA
MGPRASHGPEADQRSEPVRSRWTPKPEQILILESIFNSGMVNPPKDETVRIRKMLEKFGAVGDANVFYWFQNRRSRSRRRQRQIQASLSAAGEQPQAQPRGGGGAIQYENTVPGGFLPPLSTYPMSTSSCLQVGSGSSSAFGPGGNDGTTSNDFFPFSGRPGGLQELEQNTFFGPPETSSLHNYQSETITVFINGVATEVGRGPVDMKAMFGGDFVLFHSSGVPVQVNEFGFLVQSLQHGESYFLVIKITVLFHM